MKRSLIIFVVLALLLSGCGVNRNQAERPSATPVTTVHTITVDGATRSYILTVPVGLVGKSPLVVMLHGGFGSGSQAERSYGWDELAASESFVVAYPDGMNKAWNIGGGCCGMPGRHAIDDVTFIEAMVADIGKSVPLDDSRIYATGMSNGAMLAYRLACDSDLFAAVAPVSGTIVGDCADPKPVSVIHIHGLADTSVRMDGAEGAGVAHIDGMPIADLNSFWRGVDDCLAPIVATDGDVSTSIATCAEGRTVELITIAGAGHQWPGSKPIREGADAPYPGLDATSTIWDFLVAHPKP
ncbi:MAG: polyhydroxybutyrate depolymerase [Salinibacterium sp.]|nr:MAG: polyhydroxybutyrate depolymerase [Salinibacterium sp.]